MPPEEKKEQAKEYVENMMCSEWQNGFLLAGGTKFILFQKPGLYGEAWFNKNKDYSINCQLCERSSHSSSTDFASRSSVCPKAS